mgnify:CR=1 FL=1
MQRSLKSSQNLSPEKSLFLELIEVAGIPEPLARQELRSLLEKRGSPEDELDLEDLRAIVSEYLQDTFNGLKDELSA